MKIYGENGNKYDDPQKYEDEDDYDDDDDDNSFDDEDYDEKDADVDLTWEPCPPCPPSHQAQNPPPRAKARRCSTPEEESIMKHVQIIETVNDDIFSSTAEKES